jgi:branched-chain amino acid transport system ATP-binding protein
MLIDLLEAPLAHVGVRPPRRGVSALLVEQKLAIALKISARLYVMGHGRIVFEGRPSDFGENSAVRKEWLEV